MNDSRDIRVVIVDDHSVARRGLSQIVLDAGPFEVVGMSDGRDVMSVVTAAEPDVVLVDVGLDGDSGIAVTRRLIDLAPDLCVLVVTSSEDPTVYEASRAAGALGFVSKSEPEEVIAEAIRVVAKRGSFRKPPAGHAPDLGGSPLEALSDRELEVFRLYTAGNSGKQISETLGCAQKTAETHMMRIRTKLGMKDRRDLIQLALDYGLLSGHTGGE